MKVKIRLLLIIFFEITGLHFNASGQDQPTESVGQLTLLVRQSKPDINRISLELKLGKYYLFKPGSYKNDMDSCIYLFNQALSLSNKLHSDEWKCKTLLAIGNYDKENGAQAAGVLLYKQVIAFYHQHNDPANEGDAWDKLGDLLNVGDGYWLPSQRNCYLNAERLLTQAHKDVYAIKVLRWIATMDLNMGKLDIAETELLSGLDRSKVISNKDLIELYEHELATVYILKGMYHRALFYQLKLMASMSSQGKEDEAIYWMQIAITYSYLGMNDKALDCDKKALELYNSVGNSETFFFAVNTTVKNLLALKRPREALAIIMQAEKKHPAEGVIQKAYLFRDLAQCYAALKQNKLADKYFDALMSNYDGYLNQKVNSAEMDYYMINIGTAVQYFISVSQYKKAAACFKKIAPFVNTSMYVATKTRVLPLEVKLDSVSGNYKKAFADLSLYKRIGDSVYNSSKSQQIAEMQTEFETTQKEHAIKLLQSQSKTQQLELQTANLERNFTLGGVGLLFMLTGLAYNRYRFKQKTNEVLEAKQREINVKNESLQSLLNDKDQLITEKDWLIKEVHHRVKNNLQTVLSLLESQASFLKDDALNAIRTSQHRIYAMSLIHQKLYQDDQVTTIDIAQYLREFVESLRESFGTDDVIKFNLDLQPINMSASQAIPLALIVNEAVTNSIKYAFPDSRKGEIRISIKENAGQIALNIIDDGIGIDPELTHLELDSMGLALMKGLSTELKGKLEILNSSGTTVSITFDQDKLLSWPEDFRST